MSCDIYINSHWSIWSKTAVLTFPLFISLTFNEIFSEIKQQNFNKCQKIITKLAVLKHLGPTWLSCKMIFFNAFTLRYAIYHDAAMPKIFTNLLIAGDKTRPEVF